MCLVLCHHGVDLAVEAAAMQLALCTCWAVQLLLFSFDAFSALLVPRQLLTGSYHVLRSTALATASRANKTGKTHKLLYNIRGVTTATCSRSH